MPLFNRGNHETAPPPPPPAASEARRRTVEVMAERADMLQQLVDRVEETIQMASGLIRADRGAGAAYSQDVIRPWQEQALAAHRDLEAEALTHLADLRAATELVAGGHTALAVQKHGPLLRRLRDLEAALAAARRAKPDGLPRVDVVQTLRLARKPSTRAEEILAILLPQQETELGSVQVQDVLSRLRIEGVDATAFTTRTPGPQYVWNDPRVEAALAQEPAEAKV